MIKLGQRVRDRISGFSGVVTAYSQHLNGCDRVWISPPVDKDGKIVEGMWIDIYSLDVVDEQNCILPPETQKAIAEKPGGPPSRIK